MLLYLVNCLKMAKMKLNLMLPFFIRRRSIYEAVRFYEKIDVDIKSTCICLSACLWA